MTRAKDEDRLSKDPRQIRNRLRRREGKLGRDLELYVKHGGMKPLDEWDLEELSRGRPRDRNGQWGGRGPGWVTPAVVKEAKRRLLDHAFGSLAGHADLAIKTIADLLKSKAVDDNGKPIVDSRTRLEAAKFVIEHIIGKPKATVEIGADDAVRQALARALVLDDGEDAHPVINGQFTEDEEDDDDLK
jgi:hypothetical protein